MKRKQLLSLVVVGTLLLGVTSATSSYIHEQNGTISICDPSSNGTKCITMQDRNLGATTNDITSTGSYGYHYQWGNNHGFSIPCRGPKCVDGVRFFATGAKAVWDNSYNNYGYNGPIINFMKGSEDYWENDSHYDGLRGGSGDSQSNNRGYDEENNVATNVIGRKGPCGEGYHVPSIGEWNQVLEYLGQYNNVDERLFDYSDDGLLSLSKCADGMAVVCYDMDNDEQVDCSNENVYYECENGEYDETFGLLVQEDLKIPFAGGRTNSADLVGIDDFWSSLWSSSPTPSTWDYQSALYLYLDVCGVTSYADDLRANGFSVRCFKDSYLSFPPLVSTTNESTTTTIGLNAPITGLPETMTVTQNTISTAEGKEVLGEVNVDFGSNQTATFSHPVQVKIPVSDHEQVIVKVKHGGESEYGFAGLTRNSSASCNNGTVASTSDRYKGETINVVDGYATIYSCAASSFIALGLDVLPTVAQINLSVLKGTLTIGTEITNLNLGEVNVSNSAQELSGSFGVNSFWVEDMKGVESGFYTTISVTDLTGSVATHVISANNVYLKTAGSTPSNISGATASEAKVVFGNAIKSWHNGSGQVNYFQRLNTSTAEAGRVGKWGDNLQVKVTIPAHTPYDTYRGTITYTLYDND